MSNEVITVEGLGKEYNIGALNTRNYDDTLRDSLANTFKSTCKHILKRKSRMLGEESFWALRNASFSVKQGEVLGIVGSNGAGKSTLLKILCRVTSPTAGKAILTGRVGSLLEVGTGFHQELTGRENIFLSGAVLGMNKAHIKGRFDEIVEFSGIEKFIDTPVKRYSSGMAVRLGFAVASHLEPEILLIDEVLAVGDIVFQKKCLGKMNQITGEGRTILFVSHNLAAVKSLCSKCLLLDQGVVRNIGSAKSIVDEYRNSSFETTSFTNSTILGEQESSLSDIVINCPPNGPLSIKFNVHCKILVPVLGVDIVLVGADGTMVSRLGSGVTGFVIPQALGMYSCEVKYPEIFNKLSGGLYFVSINLSIPKIKYILKALNIGTFTIVDSDIFSTGNAVTYLRCGPLSISADFEYTSK